MLVTILIALGFFYAGISFVAGMFGIGVGMGLRGNGLALVQSFFFFALLWPVFIWYSVVTNR